MSASAVVGQHTGQSVLDKVVPGCYHRRMENGDICMSACCNNTASEHGMCERLVIDDIVHWARDYKVRLSTAVCIQLVCALLISQLQQSIILYRLIVIALTGLTDHCSKCMHT